MWWKHRILLSSNIGFGSDITITCFVLYRSSPSIRIPEIPRRNVPTRLRRNNIRDKKSPNAVWLTWRQIALALIHITGQIVPNSYIHTIYGRFYQKPHPFMFNIENLDTTKTPNPRGRQVVSGRPYAWPPEVSEQILTLLCPKSLPVDSSKRKVI